MTQEGKAYTRGMAEIFEQNGLKKEAACHAAEAIACLEKKADLFNFSDSMDNGGGFHWSSVIVPLLAAAAAGYVGYQARDKGDGNLNAFDNVKNYFAGLGDKYIRRTRPRPLYDIRRYIDG